MALSRFSLISLDDVPEWIPRRAMILLLMAIFIYQGTGILYKTLALQIIRAKPATATERTAPPAAQILRPPAGTYGVIPERNVFGVTVGAAGAAQGTAAAAQTKAPPQDFALLLDLRGTIAGEGRYGFAIVEEKPAKKQLLVRTGDVVAGAKVVRIKRNAMDLEMNGREYTLKIVETAEKPIVPPAPGRAAVPARTGAPSGPLVVNRSEIEAALQDMGTMLRQAQVRPYFSAGKPDGFLISNIRSGSLYQRLGIVDGDIIQGVNNQKIETADDVMTLFNLLKESPNVSLMLRRRGNQETLNYQFQ